MNLKAYKLTADRFDSKAGDVVYSAAVSDYGLTAFDAQMTGVDHISVTVNADGGYPTFTVPSHTLVEIPTLTEPKPEPDRAAALAFSDWRAGRQVAPEVLERRAVNALALLTEACEALREAPITSEIEQALIARIEECLGTNTPECGPQGANCRLTKDSDGRDHCMTCGETFVF